MKKFLTIISVLMLTFLVLTPQSSLAAFKKNVKTETAVPNEFENISKQATVLYAQNDIKNAFRLLLTIPEENRTAQDWLLMGNILQDENKNSEAVFMYQKSILADENYYKAYYNLANIYLNEDKPNLAIKEYKKALNLEPNSPYIYYNLGCAYVKTGELKKARNAFLSAIQLKNTVADFHYNLAYVYKKLKNEKNAKLYLEYYNKLTEQD